MTEEEIREKKRENARKWYEKNKERILTQQREYRRKRKENATKEELEEMQRKNYLRCTKYRQNHRDKFINYQRKYVAKKRELGEMPMTKDMEIALLKEKIEKLENFK